MKKIFAFLLVIITGLIISGCTQQPVTPVVQGTQTSIPVTGSIPVSLSDTSPSTTMTLDPGVILVSFHTSGTDKMGINFGNVSGGYSAGYFFSTSGPFGGSLAFQVPQKDKYLLNISGSGPWTAEVTWLKPVSVLKVPVNLSGSGTQVTPFFYLDKGQYIFERNETGLASPQYYLWYANASYVMDANNTRSQPGFGLDSPYPFRFIDIPESGIYFVSTLTNNNPGNWSASIIPVPVIPHMGPGPLITQNIK